MSTPRNLTIKYSTKAEREHFAIALTGEHVCDIFLNNSFHIEQPFPHKLLFQNIQHLRGATTERFQSPTDEIAVQKRHYYLLVLFPPFPLNSPTAKPKLPPSTPLTRSAYQPFAEERLHQPVKARLRVHPVGGKHDARVLRVLNSQDELGAQPEPHERRVAPREVVDGLQQLLGLLVGEPEGAPHERESERAGHSGAEDVEGNLLGEVDEEKDEGEQQRERLQSGQGEHRGVWWRF